MRKSKAAMVISILLFLFMTMTGFADTNERPATRIEFIKALLQLGDIEVEKAEDSSFTDVTNPEDIPYVEAAVKAGIASGYQDSFYPTDTVTKEQAVTMVLKSFGELDPSKRLSPAKAMQQIKFQDKDAISSWARSYIAYGIAQEVIDGDKEIFAPQSPITLKGLEEMMIKAKDVFTREGLTAAQMLGKTEEKLAGFDTLKYDLKLTMNSQVLDKSQDQEVSMTMEILQNAAIDQKRDKAYIISTSKAETEGEVIEAKTEMVLEEYRMYIKMPQSDKWMKQDMDPVMKELEALIGTSLERQGGISKQQMQLFGMRGTYLPEETINGEEHYVILITVDSDIYKEATDSIIKEILPLTLQMMEMEEPTQQEKMETKQKLETTVMGLIKDMEMEMEYKYYINKATKLLEKMEIQQSIHIISGIVENHTTSTGTFKYYDFNESIEFPTIEEKNILQEGILRF